MVTSEYTFNDTLLKMKNEAFVELQSYLQDCQKRSGNPKSNFSLLQEALTLIISILFRCQSLAAPLIVHLVSTLRQISLDIENVLLELTTKETDDSITSEIKRLISRIRSISESKTVKKEWQDQVKSILSTLEHFVYH